MTRPPTDHETARSMAPMRVRRSVAIVLVAVVLCSLGVSIAAIAVTGHRSAAAATDEILQRLGNRTAEHITAHLDRPIETLELTELLVDRDALAARDGELDRILAAQLISASDLTGIFVGFPDGEFRFVRWVDGDLVLKRIDVDPRRVTEAVVDEDLAVGPTTELDDAYDPTMRPWYAAATATDGPIWTDPYVFFSSGEPGVTAASAVRGPDDAVEAVIGVDVSLADLGEFLTDLPTDGEAEAFLVADGLLVAAPSGYDITRATPDGGVELSALADVDTGLDRTGDDRTASVQISDDRLPEWTVVVRGDHLGFVDVVRRQSQIALRATALAAMLLLVVIALYVIWLRRPIDDLDRRARLDPLTRLRNRRSLLDDASAAVADAARDERDLVVAILDIDDFKSINDRHGHATGDAALRRFADGLRLSMRPDDIAGRLGGDEFVVVLSGLDRRMAGIVLERVRDVAVAELRSAPSTAGSTISIGATSLDGRRDIDLRSLIAEADDRLLATKHGAKGEISWMPDRRDDAERPTGLDERRGSGEATGQPAAGARVTS